MSTQATLNSIEQALQLIRRVEIKIGENEVLLKELTPHWIERTKNKLLRLKDAVETSIKWGNPESGRWNNAQSLIDGTCRDLKLEELSQLDWKDTKTIISKFKEGWRVCAANGSTYTSLCRLIEEASGFYLDPEFNVAEIERMKLRSEAAEKEIRRIQNELSEALKLNAIGQSVERQSKFFEEIAEECQRGAKKWLIAISLLCASLISCGILIIFFDKVGNLSSNAELLNHVAGRVLVVTAIFYFLRIATQNYRANRHNFTINTHRAKALKIYGVLVKAVEDKSTQSIILSKAADAIFGHQVSGHNPSVNANENTDLRVNVNTENPAK